MVQESVARSGQKDLPKSKKLLLVVGLLVLALAAAVFVARAQHQHTISTDKARFAQADKDVQAVAQQIISAVGQPVDQRTNNYCSRPHQKFTQGPLSCTVYDYLAYSVGNSDQANSVARKVTDAAKQPASPWKLEENTTVPGTISGLTSSGKFQALLEDQTQTKSFSYANQESTMICSISYLYYPAALRPDGYPRFLVNSNQIFLIDISCVKGAEAQFYPLQN
ncbi:MAG TPA: hypothetical protein VLG13_01105 [Patescibacteria group bacterium]|nr:hypothetical protein [Patescibacteria group bacterium]